MIIGQFVQLRRSLSTALSNALVLLFGGLGSWGDTEADEFIAGAVPLVQGAQRNMAALTSNYIAAQATEAAGRLIVPPSVPDNAVLGLRGVSPSTVYRRPFVAMRMSLAKGDELSTAVKRGETRLRQVAEGDLQQTHSSAAREALRALPEDAKPSGWRRVLNGDENCGLCVVASTNLYTVDTLNPMHPLCDCSVQAVFGSHPAVGPESYARVKAAVEEITGNRTRATANELRGLVVEHGELGPMLVRPKDHFTSADDLPS